MKALVLSGGAGTRSRPSTHASTGQLVSVADQAVPSHGPRSRVDAGITPAAVIVGGTAAFTPVRGVRPLRLTPGERPLRPVHAVPTARDRPTHVPDPPSCAVAELCPDETPERPGSDLARRRPPLLRCLPPHLHRGARRPRRTDVFMSRPAAAPARADEPGTAPGTAPRTRRAALRLSALCTPFPSGSRSSARSPVMGSSQQVCSTEPVPSRAAGTAPCGACSGTSVDPCRVDPTSSGASHGPAPRAAHSALGHDRRTEVAPGSHRDRRSALHEALPHIRKEISQ
ncbi:hypothetical protein TUSST3_60780 [Streptomyces sp. TUS-ST3]|nr:hypothetical protein TUSST3_60780 [Streptomyces sp. TUS-ST3]